MAAAAASNPPVVQSVVEETEPPVEIDASIVNRKNQKTPTVEKPTTNNRTASVKKTKPRRFVWTLNKVIVLFGIFAIVTLSSIIYMFKEIS